MGEHPPFCITKFLGSIFAKQRTLRLEVMVPVAALRFERNPCACDGCVAFLAEMYRRANGEQP